MAQNFDPDFGVDETDDRISIVDAAGVVLTAIQELAMQVLRLKAEIETLKLDVYKPDDCVRFHHCSDRRPTMKIYTGERAGITAVVVILIALSMGTGHGQNPTVPNLVAFQARITNAGNQSVPDGTYPVTFKIFRNQTGGLVEWTESLNLAVTDGILIHNLGSTPSFELPTALFFSQDSVWVETTFSGEVLAPRILLVSAPYARLADGLSARSMLHPDQLAVYTDVENHRLVIDGKNASTVVDLFGKDWGSLKLTDSVGIDAAVLSTNGAGGGSLDLQKSGGGGGGVYLHGGSLASGATFRMADEFGSTAISMDVGLPGDNAVSLPAGSISSNEILDEPGIASDNDESILGLSAGTTTICSRIIIAPASGYVLAIGTCQADVGHTVGVEDSASFGISTSTSLPVVGRFIHRMSSSAAAGMYSDVVTVQTILSIPSSVPTTFRLLASGHSGTYSVRDRQLSLVFIPSPYGTYDPPSAPDGDNLSAEFQPDDIDHSVEVSNPSSLRHEVALLRVQAEATARRLAELEAIMPKW